MRQCRLKWGDQPSDHLANPKSGIVAVEIGTLLVQYDDRQVRRHDEHAMFTRVLQLILACGSVFVIGDQLQDGHISQVKELVRKWAPLVFMAPGEMFYPGSVPEFLDHMIEIPYQKNFNSTFDYNLDHLNEVVQSDDLPVGGLSESWYLVTKSNVDNLITNKSSFLYGHDPHTHSIPVYALITMCKPRDFKSKIKPYTSKRNQKMFSITIGKMTNEELYEENNELDNSLTQQDTAEQLEPHFHVTYWMFYPYSQGKSVCTLDMGPFGPWPIPKVNNHCYGNMQEYGGHVGDWEHMSLYFQGQNSPVQMYVSAHDAGAFYRYSKTQHRFEFERQELRRGILQRPMFPPIVRISKPETHPVLFAAKGSHGLWTLPGKHRFVRLPRLYDDSGFGVPWFTWKNIEFLQTESQTARNWLKFRGRWGNPKSRCHPLSKLGIHICEQVDGPTGIPMKEFNFHCPKKIIN